MELSSEPELTIVLDEYRDYDLLIVYALPLYRHRKGGRKYRKPLARIMSELSASYQELAPYHPYRQEQSAKTPVKHELVGADSDIAIAAIDHFAHDVMRGMAGSSSLELRLAAYSLDLLDEIKDKTSA